MNGQVLVVDDEPSLCELVGEGLSARGYAVSWRTSGESALSLLDQQDFEVMLADIRMEGIDGLDLCRRALDKRPDLCVIMMTGFGSLESAVGAIRAGAHDFVSKPISNDVLALSVERGLRHRRLSSELKRLRQDASSPEFAPLIGSSPAMQRLKALIGRIATSDANVLITGESGTGKELVARALHEQSGRRGRFVALNCAAMPEQLLESELFGHVRGAFTDAKVARPGVFVQANDGTLFLDEIGDMPLTMQAKLLRALQQRTVRPVGSSHEVPFSARVLAATNRDLELDVAARRFREDLYYRINVVRVEVPPLRLRGDDVVSLANQFLERIARRSGRPMRLGPEVAERLGAYDWPGNVRELENCIERAVALAGSDEITLGDLPQRVREHAASEMAEPGELLPMEVVERRYIRKVLDAVGGNKTRAAKVLGLDRRTLYRKISH